MNIISRIGLDFKNKNPEEIIVEFITWVKNRWQSIASITGIIIVFGGLLIYFISNYNTAKIQSWEKISYAQGYASQGMTAQSIQLLDDIINKYPNSEVGQFAKFTKAEISYKTNNFNLAATLYQEIVAANKSKNITPFAYAGLGNSKENLGKFQEAIGTYNEFLAKYPDHFLASRIYDSLARCYLLNGNAEQAKEIYNKIVTLYPGSYWSNQLQKQTQQN